MFIKRERQNMEIKGIQRELPNSCINGIFGALGIFRGWVFLVRRKLQSKTYFDPASWGSQTAISPTAQRRSISTFILKRDLYTDIELKGQAPMQLVATAGIRPETFERDQSGRLTRSMELGVSWKMGSWARPVMLFLDDSSPTSGDVESGFRARPCPEVDLYFFGRRISFCAPLLILTSDGITPLATLCSKTGGVGIGLYTSQSTQI